MLKEQQPKENEDAQGTKLLLNFISIFDIKTNKRQYVSLENLWNSRKKVKIKGRPVILASLWRKFFLAQLWRKLVFIKTHLSVYFGELLFQGNAGW